MNEKLSNYMQYQYLKPFLSLLICTFPVLSEAQPKSAGGNWATINPMFTARAIHIAVLMPNNKVLVAGGENQATAELYDPAANSWSYAGGMSTPRSHYGAALLNNGQVLVVGGLHDNSASGVPLTTAELYNPTTGVWSSTGSMTNPRWIHSVTKLQNGKILVAGGCLDRTYNATATAEIYNPDIGTWSAAGNMNAPRRGHFAIALPNGKVLVAGGSNGGYLASAELYDPATNSWSNTGSMHASRYRHSAGNDALLLNNGQILVTGGETDGGYILATAELYNPATGVWTATGNMHTARRIHAASLLRNGKVLVAGGFITNSCPATATAELYDPSTGTWSDTNAMSSVNSFFTLTTLPNDKILAAGGYYCTNYLANAALYTPDVVAAATSLTSSSNPAFTGQNLTFTASVTSANAVPVGTLTFKVDGVTKQAGTLSAGRATYVTSALTTGTHTISAQFMGNATFGANSTQLTQTVNVAADFGVTSVTLTPTVLVANSTFTAAVVIKNSGTTVGDGGQLRLWLHQPATQLCNATADKTLTVGVLNAGASKTFTFSALPTGSGGIKTLRTFVDATCATPESNEVNNQYAVNYRIGHALVPDFVITALNVVPATPAANGVFTATVTVKNQGSTPLNDIYLDVWANQATAPACQATGDAWLDVGTMVVGSIKTFTVTNLPAGAAGVKTLRAFVDSWCEVTESNETNNQLTKSYTVQ